MNSRLILAVIAVAATAGSAAAQPCTAIPQGFGVSTVSCPDGRTGSVHDNGSGVSTGLVGNQLVSMPTPRPAVPTIAGLSNLSPPPPVSALLTPLTPPPPHPTLTPPARDPGRPSAIPRPPPAQPLPGANPTIPGLAP